MVFEEVVSEEIIYKVYEVRNYSCSSKVNKKGNVSDYLSYMVNIIENTTIVLMSFIVNLIVTNDVPITLGEKVVWDPQEDVVFLNSTLLERVDLDF